jgi:uncharacterized protein YqjF (DUF2071 family)
MNTSTRNCEALGTDQTDQTDRSDVARRRVLSLRGDPFLLADWKNVVFLHHVLEPEILRPLVPAPLELELHEGRACVSVVALTMRRFRPFRSGAVAAWFFRPLATQSFLNVRTYVRWGEEPGALFLWGWLSRPFGVGLPLNKIGLPCGFCDLKYEHAYESGRVVGVARGGAQRTAGFAYQAAIKRDIEFKACKAGSLAEFAMERYTGFFCQRGEPRIFRAWHEPWLEATIEAKIEDDSLLRERFPWFREAKFAGANFAPGFDGVWLGRAHGLEKVGVGRQARRRVLSAFYEMP